VTQRRQAELGAFVRERRGRVTPQDVGLPNGGRRRTPGLRREEVAQLAGVSMSWYTWLEQGRDMRPSPSVAHARYIDDPDFAALISELEEGSPDFRAWWPRHELRLTVYAPADERTRAALADFVAEVGA